eukprot:gb/GEZN01013975.1/.p1 GENE.gb/GEZN01013975.1/~~gb/GEZN01013975.1/.p1  ORF type:complete len:241 (+),score=11.83 gb/GEZN01013975.1/:164-886(+)
MRCLQVWLLLVSDIFGWIGGARAGWDFFLQPMVLKPQWWLPFEDAPFEPLNCQEHTNYLNGTGDCVSFLSNHLLCMTSNLERVMRADKGHFVVGGIDQQILSHFRWKEAFSSWLCATEIDKIPQKIRASVVAPKDSYIFWTQTRRTYDALFRHAAILNQIYRRPTEKMLKKLEAIPLWKVKYVGIHLRGQDGGCIAHLTEACGPFLPPNFQIFPDRTDPEYLCNYTFDYIDVTGLGVRER